MDPKTVLEQIIPFVARSGLKVVTLEPRHIALRMPLEGNANHVGTMYAGALFTLSEIPGGAMFMSTFDPARFYPLVKGVEIKFVKAATSDITVEVKISEAEAQRVAAQAEAQGKADYGWDCELVDANGVVVAVSTNRYQLRKIG